MTEKQFLEKMVDLLDTEEEVTLDTVLADIEEWDSISLVGFLAFANNHSNSKITAADVRKAQTINDLYEMVKA